MMLASSVEQVNWAQVDACIPRLPRRVHAAPQRAVLLDHGVTALAPGDRRDNDAEIVIDGMPVSFTDLLVDLSLKLPSTSWRNEFMRALLGLLTLGADPSHLVSQPAPNPRGMGWVPLLATVQAISVLEWREYSRAEQWGGGRYRFARIAIAYVAGAVTLEDAQAAAASRDSPRTLNAWLASECRASSKPKTARSLATFHLTRRYPRGVHPPFFGF
jgi:hypothetical protein